MRGIAGVCVLLLIGAVGACGDAYGGPPPLAGWTTPTGMTGPLYTIGGCVLLPQTAKGRFDFVVVHDNKSPKEPRIGRVTVQGSAATYTPVEWPTDWPADFQESDKWPADLEAGSQVPDRAGRFALLASAGTVYVVDVKDDKAAFCCRFDLPNRSAGDNYEALSLAKIGGALAVVWGERGDEKTTGTLSWGVLEETPDHKSYVVKPGGAWTGITVPSPDGAQTREISDLKVDAGGIVWGSAAQKKPSLESAAYVFGVLTDPTSPTGLTHDAPVKIRTFEKHKAEAVEIVSGVGIVYGADDETGGAIHFD